MLVFVTNQFDLPALIIAQIYRRRWAIELFFRWIKPHLRLRGFYSTSFNGDQRLSARGHCQAPIAPVAVALGNFANRKYRLHGANRSSRAVCNY